MKIAYATKEAATAAIPSGVGVCFSAVWISKHYAALDGVEGDAWYLFNNASKKLV